MVCKHVHCAMVPTRIKSSVEMRDLQAPICCASTGTPMLPFKKLVTEL
jgi:hypothetical protein